MVRVVLANLMLIFCSYVAFAAPLTSSVVIDLADGGVVYANEASRPWFPASTTKLMTAYVALRAVRSGVITFDTPIVASKIVASQPPSKIGLKPGQEITLGNAIKILIVKSANDVAVAVAEGIGGSVEGFSTLMNKEAARLGMRESHFVNPHGLHHEAHVSSARDMAILARALLLEFPEYQALWGIGAVQLGQRKMLNTNGLVGRYPGIIGMKTGFVCTSGFNLVSAASRGGRTLIAVIFGSPSAGERTIAAAELLDHGFASGGGASAIEVHSIPSSSGLPPPNLRAEVCSGRRSHLGEVEEGAPPPLMGAEDEFNRPDFALRGAPASPAFPLIGNVGYRNGNKIVLAPRETFVPLSVSLGRVPGSQAAPVGAVQLLSNASSAKKEVKTSIARRSLVVKAPAQTKSSTKANSKQQKK